MVNIIHSTSIVHVKRLLSILLTLDDIFDRDKGWVSRADGTWLFVLKPEIFKSLTLNSMKTWFVCRFFLPCSSKSFPLKLAVETLDLAGANERQTRWKVGWWGEDLAFLDQSEARHRYSLYFWISRRTFQVHGGRVFGYWSDSLITQTEKVHLQLGVLRCQNAAFMLSKCCTAGLDLCARGRKMLRFAKLMECPCNKFRLFCFKCSLLFA